jgi:hypothetical protein
MSAKRDRAILLAHGRLAAQRRWIADHGSTLSAYRQRYGSAKDEHHYGDGGEAIYAADMARLRHLEDEVEALTGRRPS